MKAASYFTACVVISLFVSLESCTPTEDHPEPVITTVTPLHGVVGTTVTITGNYFEPDPIVGFNGVAAEIVSASKTELVVTVPDDATPGKVSVRVRQTTMGPYFTVDFAPVISTVSPLNAKVGETVTITGDHFSSITTKNLVKFNGISATVMVASASQLEVKVPNGATTGIITIEVDELVTTGPVFTVNP